MRLIPILLLLFALNAHGQYAHKKREVGFNMTNIITNAFGLNDQDDHFDPHTLSLRFPSEVERRATRLKLGLNIRNNISNSVDGNGNTQSVLKDNYSVIRIGIEKLVPLSLKMQCYVGWELGISYSELETGTTSFNTETKSNIFSFGGGIGPYMGFQYYFNERISIFTESNLFAEVIYSEIEFDNGFTPPSTDYTTEIELRHFLPSSIYLAISF